jgi:hypothetical protein
MYRSGEVTSGRQHTACHDSIAIVVPPETIRMVHATSVKRLVQQNDVERCTRPKVIIQNRIYHVCVNPNDWASEQRSGY